MMKYLKLLVIAIGFLAMAACSNSASYNPEVCKTLEEKINSKETLTESDYSTMIDQLHGIAVRLNQEKEKAGNDAEKQKEFAKTEGKELYGYMFGFALYLSTHTEELSPANLKKFQKLNEEFEKMKEK